VPYRGCMRVADRRWAGVACPGMLAIALLTGCTQPSAPVPTAPMATDAPVFASDEEALAAATVAYAAYQETSDLILADGGIDPERIREVVSEKMAVSEMTGFAQARAEGLRSIGKSIFDTISIQSVDQAPVDGTGAVTVYLCSDVSGVDILNAIGTSVVSPSRTERTRFEVTFDLSTRGINQLVVGSRSVWTSGGLC
jgi:hypothetical protein